MYIVQVNNEDLGAPHGPFETRENAEEWADTFLGDTVEWTVQPLGNPEEGKPRIIARSKFEQS